MIKKGSITLPRSTWTQNKHHGRTKHIRDIQIPGSSSPTSNICEY